MNAKNENKYKKCEVLRYFMICAYNIYTFKEWL